MRAYALDLESYSEFLRRARIEWDQVSLEQLGQFTAWLRQPAGNVLVLASGRTQLVDG